MNDSLIAEVGNTAPDFSLPDETGELVSLSEFKNKSVVVLYFYPKDNTPVCTAQACSFRDSYESFKDAGAEVIGISSDSVESHKSFGKENQLPFHLLSDRDGKVRKRYGATILLWIPGRVTFIVDKEGVIRHKLSSLFKANTHIRKAMDLIRTLD